MKRLVLFSILTLILVSSTSAFANGISLDTYRERLDITPGDEVQGTIAVRNFSTQDITVKAYTQDFLYTAPFNGKMDLTPAEPNQYSCKDWITVIPEEFTIPAAQARKIAYTIKAPAEAKGGYYGMIILEEAKKGASSGTGLTVNVGCTMLLETKGSVKDLKLREAAAQQDAITGNFQNSCDLVLVSKPSFVVMDKKGAVLDRGELAEFYLPPGEKAPFKVKVSGKVPTGDYTLEFNFSFYGRGSLVKDISFSKDAAGNLKVLQVEE